MHKTLLEIHKEEDLDEDYEIKKGTAKFIVHPYAEDYDNIFSKWRDKPVKLLEIGAFFGASTIIWDKYFQQGDITVIDIDTSISSKNILGRVDPNRTKLIEGDAYTKEMVESLGNFDIINDDGPHTLESMKKCIELYYPKLNEGGVLIIEDIPNASWFEELRKVTPTDKIETIDYIAQNKGRHDSRIFIIYK